MLITRLIFHAVSILLHVNIELRMRQTNTAFSLNNEIQISAPLNIQPQAHSILSLHARFFAVVFL